MILVYTCLEIKYIFKIWIRVSRQGRLASISLTLALVSLMFKSDLNGNGVYSIILMFQNSYQFIVFTWCSKGSHQTWNHQQMRDRKLVLYWLLLILTRFSHLLTTSKSDFVWRPLKKLWILAKMFICSPTFICVQNCVQSNVRLKIRLYPLTAYYSFKSYVHDSLPESVLAGKLRRFLAGEHCSDKKRNPQVTFCAGYEGQ